MSDLVTSLFRTLQDDVEAKLEGEQAFAGPPMVPVVTERHGELENVIERAVAKYGLCALVMTPRWESGASPHSLQTDVVVDVIEVPVMNRGKSMTQVAAADLGLYVVALLHHWTPDEDVWTKFEWKRTEVAEISPRLVYEITFGTMTVLRVE